MSKLSKSSQAPTSFRFSDEVKAALKIISNRESRSMANAIEWLSKDYFKRKGLDWPVASTHKSVKEEK